LLGENLAFTHNTDLLFPADLHHSTNTPASKRCCYSITQTYESTRKREAKYLRNKEKHCKKSSCETQLNRLKGIGEAAGPADQTRQKTHATVKAGGAQAPALPMGRG